MWTNYFLVYMLLVSICSLVISFEGIRCCRGFCPPYCPSFYEEGLFENSGCYDFWNSNWFNGDGSNCCFRKETDPFETEKNTMDTPSTFRAISPYTNVRKKIEWRSEMDGRRKEYIQEGQDRLESNVNLNEKERNWRKVEVPREDDESDQRGWRERTQSPDWKREYVRRHERGEDPEKCYQQCRDKCRKKCSRNHEEDEEHNDRNDNEQSEVASNSHSKSSCCSYGPRGTAKDVLTDSKGKPCGVVVQSMKEYRIFFAKNQHCRNHCRPSLSPSCHCRCC